jgi:hypothetical protein
MFIVRRQDIMHNRGGASYMIEASKDYGRKYRMSKTRKAVASRFNTKKTAQKWASVVGGEVVKI